MPQKEARTHREADENVLSTPGNDESTPQLTRTERSILAKLAGVIRFADFMAVMMVLATLFSAYATWRTAQVTRLIFEISDRPFLGVQGIGFEAVDSDRPTITVDVRNFAKIPSVDSIVSLKPRVDGKLIEAKSDELTIMESGILSPGVPHHYYASLSPELYRAVIAGKSNLMVGVRMLYKGPTHEMSYCYYERAIYDFGSKSFRMAGGTDRCGSDIY
jgi:hypothetical protein